MKLSKIFARAKRTLQETNEIFICLAIKYDDGIPEEDRARAIEVVFERLNGRPRTQEERRLKYTGVCLASWLIGQGLTVTSSGVNAHRLKWLDMLIKEFKAKGD